LGSIEYVSFLQATATSISKHTAVPATNLWIVLSRDRLMAILSANKLSGTLPAQRPDGPPGSEPLHAERRQKMR
jgi:hypothetical protein